jgi:hypothetical protein
MTDNTTSRPTANDNNDINDLNDQTFGNDSIEEEEVIVEENGNGKENKNVKPKNNDHKREEVFLQKYTDGLLAEAILIAGRPYFLVSENKEEISIVQSIELEDKIVKPLTQDMYLSRPYTFTSEQEVRKYIEKTKKENLDTIFHKVKSLYRKYVDADDFHISICAADIVYTYYQDKIGLTHYLFFVGNNDSGKSNNLRVIHILSYRNFMSIDVTAPNIYQFLGNKEEGQGTLCIDEADNIDASHELMSISKNGYTKGFRVARIDTSSGRKQYGFFTFGFKAFAAERLPDSVKAKGFNQRTISLPCIYGIPQYDISEILNPAGEQEHQALLDELNETRNTLLIYRLLHHNDNIPDIKLNLNGREKQLFKPILRIFQNTQIQNELLPIISKYISDRRESNCNSLYAFLYKVIKDLIKAQDTSELESNLIWNTITDLLPGDSIPNKKLSYESTEFGMLSQKGIVEILIQIFGAKHSKDRRDKSKLIFDIHKLSRVGRAYELSIDVKASTTSSAVTDVTDVTHIGLDKHFVEQSSEGQLDDSNILNDNNPKDIEENNDNNKEIIVRKGKEDQTMNVHPSQASYPSPIEESPSSYSASLPSSEKEQQSSISLTIATSIDEVSSTPSSQLQEQQHKRFNCFYCNQYYSSDKERIKHIDSNHPGKLYYPTPEDFEKRL